MSGPEDVRIVVATAGDDLGHARRLFEAYAATLDFDLDFQGFADELKNLPGDYGPPAGVILLGVVGGRRSGCVALRDLGEGSCELTRLFVETPARGRRLGHALAEAVVNEARRLGYDRARLHTLPAATAAVRVYTALGFRKIEPYCDVPIPDATFMELELR